MRFVAPSRRRIAAALAVAGAALLAGCAKLPLELPLKLERPIVLLGEVHDNAAQHAIRLRAFEAWLARGMRPALLMEQFDRDQQPRIDALRKDQPGADADRLIAAAGGSAGWDWSHYRPFIALALRHGLPIVAANVSRADARRVIQDGLGAHGFDAAVPADILAGHADAIAAAHCGQIDAATAQRMAQAQVARDQFMARQVDAYAARGVVLLAGNGHVRTDLGVPRWLSPPTRARSESIGLLEPEDPDPQAYDRVVVTPAQTRADPCAGVYPRRTPAAHASRDRVPPPHRVPT
jgi:uncharacterized iron-regulated protein